MAALEDLHFARDDATKRLRAFYALQARAHVDTDQEGGGDEEDDEDETEEPSEDDVREHIQRRLQAVCSVVRLTAMDRSLSEADKRTIYDEAARVESEIVSLAVFGSPDERYCSETGGIVSTWKDPYDGGPTVSLAERHTFVDFLALPGFDDWAMYLAQGDAERLAKAKEAFYAHSTP